MFIFFIWAFGGVGVFFDRFFGVFFRGAIGFGGRGVGRFVVVGVFVSIVVFRFCLAYIAGFSIFF